MNIGALIITAILALAVGFFAAYIITRSRKQSADEVIEKAKTKAQKQAKAIIAEADKKAESLRAEAKRDADKRMQDVKEERNRVAKKESFLDQRQLDMDKERDRVQAREKEIEAEQKKLADLATKRQSELEGLAGLSTDQARDELIKTIEIDTDEAIQSRLRKLEQSGEDKLKRRAQEILTTVIHRLASPTASEVTTTHVPVPDESKGKIIGKEGRNIKSFEQVAGVELIVDEAPGTIVISCFDPIHRQVALMRTRTLSPSQD